jgi:hypothetical protein
MFAAPRAKSHEVQDLVHFDDTELRRRRTTAHRCRSMVPPMMMIMMRTPPA